MLREHESGKDPDLHTWAPDTANSIPRIWDICTSEADLAPLSPLAPNSERACHTLRPKTAGDTSMSYRRSRATIMTIM